MLFCFLGKTLWELIEPCKIRMDGVKDFLNDICPELSYEILPIQDPFGPTRFGKDMDMLVVSEETVAGGQKVNIIRQTNKLDPLDILTVDLVDFPHKEDCEEDKVSSSTTRMRLLGTLLKNIDIPYIEGQPYVVGLTGGIASGKTNISTYLTKLGIAHINCDIIGHELYQIGKPCHTAIRETFGEKVIATNGEINRKALGEIVFSNQVKLRFLLTFVQLYLWN